MGRYSQIMTRLQILDGESLSQFLNYGEGIQDYVRKAAQKAKRTDFLKAATIAALEQAQKDHCDDDDIIGLRMALTLIYAENQEEDKAIEHVREIYELDQVSRQPSFSAQWCAGMLAELYYIKACALRRGSLEYQACVAELREMEKREHSPFGGDISTDQYDAGLFLGLILCQEGKDEEAQPFFKERIALGLGLLEDDELDNDVDAWGVLGFALCKSGDLLNGEAAVACWAGEENNDEDDSDEESDSTDDDEDDDSSKLRSENGNKSGSNISDDQSTFEEDDEDQDDDYEAKIEANEQKGLEPDAGTATKTSDPVSPISQTVVGSEPKYELQHTLCSFTSCQGPCNAEFEDNPKIAFLCVACYYTAFCSDCLPLLESMPYKKCDPTHTRIPIRFPPKDLPEDKIIVDNKLRDLNEWKNEIRKNWDLPTIASAIESK